MGIDSKKLSEQFLKDVERFGLTSDLFRMYVKSVYQAGYEDARDHSWWKEQERDRSQQ